jgi:glycosyltransferase involved in cell wall biosynthesis
VLGLAARRNVEVIADVPRIEAYIQRARVSVCPVRLAIGSQTKVLEAMACGTPVVTTAAGNRGIGGLNGVHLYVDDDPADMAAHIVALLDGDEWEGLSTRGRRFVLDNFGWEKSGTKLEGIIRQVSRKN